MCHARTTLVGVPLVAFAVLAVLPSVARAHPQLPGGGGYQVCGLYGVAPAKFGLGDEVVTRASNYGNGKSRVSDDSRRGEP
jgi:hypothetical protein